MQKNRPDITEEKAARLRELINGAVRDCLVKGYQPLIEALDLPDPDDRHVLAAAIKVNAQLIVTRNLKDFPPKTLEKSAAPHATMCLSTGLAKLPIPREFHAIKAAES